MFSHNLSISIIMSIVQRIGSRLMLLVLSHMINDLGRKSIHFPFMITSSNRNIFRVTGPLRGGSTGHRWIPLPKASDAELWRFLWSAPEQMVEQAIETLVIWDAIALIMMSLQCAKACCAMESCRYKSFGNEVCSKIISVKTHLDFPNRQKH